jgi:hypothetical protein
MEIVPITKHEYDARRKGRIRGTYEEHEQDVIKKGDKCLVYTLPKIYDLPKEQTSEQLMNGYEISDGELKLDTFYDIPKKSSSSTFCWWLHPRFLFAAHNGLFLRHFIGKHKFNIDYNVTAEHLASFIKSLIKGWKNKNDDYLRFKPLIKEMHNVSFYEALNWTRETWPELYKQLIASSTKNYLMLCNDPCATDFIMKCSVICEDEDCVRTPYYYEEYDSWIFRYDFSKDCCDKLRVSIEKYLTIRAQVEDSVLVAQKEYVRVNIEKQLARCAQDEDAVLLNREKANEKALRVAQWRKERQELKARKILERDTHLQSRTNCSSSKRGKGLKLQQRQESHLKQISIEKSIQHENDLKQRERQRVAELEKKMTFVHIGNTIQQGDD